MPGLRWSGTSVIRRSTLVESRWRFSRCLHWGHDRRRLPIDRRCRAMRCRRCRGRPEDHCEQSQQGGDSPNWSRSSRASGQAFTCRRSGLVRLRRATLDERPYRREAIATVGDCRALDRSRWSGCSTLDDINILWASYGRGWRERNADIENVCRLERR